MYLKYWYEDELNCANKVYERGSNWIYLNSREFERVFGYKEMLGTYVMLTQESDDKGDSTTQRYRKVAIFNRMEEAWKNLKKFKNIRVIAVPYRIMCCKEMVQD